jgi:cyanophycin synthetase
MFAAALAYNMDVSLEHIRHGLRTFDSTFFQAPGRMNIYAEHPFKVILDYAHNPAAVRAMCNLVDRFEVKGRKLVVLAAPGDRRDEDIKEIARLAADHFDHFICRVDDNQRGRGPDEVARMLQAQLLESGVKPEQIEVIPDEQTATQYVLDMAAADDLILVLADQIKRSWKQIIYFDSSTGEAVGTEAKTTTIALPDVDLFTFDEDVQIISDERGVRIARDAGD